MKAAIVFLILASLGLGVGLMWRHKQAVEVKKQDEEKIVLLSNRVEETKNRLDDQEKLAMYLQTNLVLRTEELSGASNSLTKLSADLARTQKEMQAAAEAAKQEIERRDAQIAQLTSQTNALTQKMDDLTAPGIPAQRTQASPGREGRIGTPIQRPFRAAHPGGQAQRGALHRPPLGMDPHGHLRHAGKEGRRTAHGRGHAPVGPEQQLQSECGA